MNTITTSITKDLNKQHLPLHKHYITSVLEKMGCDMNTIQWEEIANQKIPHKDFKLSYNNKTKIIECKTDSHYNSPNLVIELISSININACNIIENIPLYKLITPKNNNYHTLTNIITKCLKKEIKGKLGYGMNETTKPNYVLSYMFYKENCNVKHLLINGLTLKHFINNNNQYELYPLTITKTTNNNNIWFTISSLIPIKDLKIKLGKNIKCIMWDNNKNT